MEQSDWQGRGINAWLIILQSTLEIFLKKKKLLHYPADSYDGVNITILVNLAVVIESYTKSIMLREMSKHNQNDSHFTRTMVHYLKVKIEGSTFSDLISMWPIVYDSKFSELIVNSGDIHKLMSFRNKLVHGNTLEIKFNRVSNEIKYQNSLSDFQAYFDKLNLTKPFAKDTPSIMPFLSHEIVQHFFTQTILFLKNYSSIVHDQVSIHAGLPHIIKVEQSYLEAL